MENKSIARKQLSRQLTDNTETVINEYREFVFEESILSDMRDEFDDYEAAASNGVFSDYDDDIAIINVDKCCEYLSETMSDEKEEEQEETYRYLRCERIYLYLKRWKGFEISV